MTEADVQTAAGLTYLRRVRDALGDHERPPELAVALVAVRLLAIESVLLAESPTAALEGLGRAFDDIRAAAEAVAMAERRHRWAGVVPH